MTEVSSNPAVWAGFEAPDGLELGWKVVRPDGRTTNDFQWPFKGVVRAPKPRRMKFSHGDPCPVFPGDGLCIAKTWAGAASGGIPAITGLALAYDPADVLGEDGTKLRVSKCRVLGVMDLQRLIRDCKASRANLSRANLSGADLSGADLSGANFSRANLSTANLSGANLSGADLFGANLSGADLFGADLSGANLSTANLSRANLFGANLSGADLSGANLSRANLSRANLSRADLSGAINVPASQ